MVARKFPMLGRAEDYGFLWPVARGLALRDHKVTVIASHNPQGKVLIQQEHVQAHFIGGKYAHDEEFPRKAEQKFAELHAKEPFHIVHSLDDSALLIGKNKKNYRVAMTYDIQATLLSEVYSLLGLSQETLPSLIRTAFRVAYTFIKTFYGHDRGLLRTADGVFVTSPAQRLTLERHYLYPELRTYVVPYGIEIGDLSPRERSEELRKKLGLPGNANTIVTITDMNEISEIRNLLRAFVKVAIKKPTARLIIVGHGPLFKEVEWEMLNLALGSRVVFVKEVSPGELSDFIALADTFVNLSARTTGFEPSLIEAMAQKKVIIGSEVSPISTIVEDGVDGFLIRPADANTLAKLLVQIFSDQLPITEIGEKARKKVLDLFEVSKMVNTTINAYYKTLSNSGYYKKSAHLSKV